MHQRQTCRLWCEFQSPVQGGVASTEDHEMLAVHFGGIPHAITDRAPLEFLGAVEAETPRLEGANAACDHDRARIERGAARGADVETAILLAMQLRHFLPQMKLGIERLD